MAERFEQDANYFHSVVLSSPDYIRIIDLDGRVEFLNASALKTLISSSRNPVGIYWPDLWPAEDDRRKVIEALDAARRGETRSFRACLIREGLEPLWVDTTVSPVFAKGGETVSRILAVSRDVTEEVRSRALLDTILDCVPAALFAKELETSRIVFLNEAASKMFGHPAEAMIGKTAHTFVRPSQADAIREADLAAAATTETIVLDNEVVTQMDGRTHIRRTRKKASPGPGQRYIVCLTEDIGQERARQAALERALEEAEAADRAKSQFLAVMSHEIRSPLNGVLGMAQAMELGELPPEQRRKLQVIREAGSVLLDLLNDMLDLTRISAGGLQLEDGVVDGDELVRSARNLFDGLAADKDLSFELELDPVALGPWRGDQTRVRQIVTNLIGNAVKFTDRGRITLRILPETEGFRLEVSDTGPGIPADRLGRIFDPFDQLDPSNTRRHGGSGLGLAICRDLAELMDGDISVTSVVGVGSTFVLRLPLQRAETAAADPGLDAPAPLSAPAGGRPLRILAAEDNPMNQMVLATLLGAVGLEPVIVSNGQEAVEAFASQPWDLILMDVQMPVMDGIDAARAIRAAERAEGRPATPIIALTANAMQHQLDDYRACGMTATVSKPVEIRALLSAIHAATEPAEDRRALSAGS
ncbi:MAG: PAS domain-containing hybrid sensor histidine kinase/response regulator [Caulobacteraceae bacterium]